VKIGMRIPGALSKTPFEEYVRWCKENRFDAIDLGGPDAAQAKTVRDAGLEVGTIDLRGTGKLCSADEAVRKEGIGEAIASVNAIADAGANKAFCVFFPPDHSQSRRVSFENWKQAFPAVAAEAEKRGVRIAVEGWPGPNNSALGVTPETLRAMFEAVPTDAFGINFDPSHLIRIGVDYQRCLDEFASRVIHAHGKDTAFDPEGTYLSGRLGATFAKPPAFGDADWRYCIPGEGIADWAFICGRLHRAGFDGVVSIELEDFRYNGTADGERLGLLRSRDHLSRYL
jgi:sugar phosphate isomerase/epimerase